MARESISDGARPPAIHLLRSYYPLHALRPGRCESYIG
jgi:hypothetical protein